MRSTLFDQFATKPLPTIAKILETRIQLSTESGLSKTPQQLLQERKVQNAGLFVLDSLTRRLMLDSSIFSVVALSKLLSQLRIKHRTRSGYIAMGEDREVVVPHCWLELPPDQRALAKGNETGPVVDVTPNFFFACHELKLLHDLSDEEFQEFLKQHEASFDLVGLNMTKEEIVRNKIGRPFVLCDQPFSSAETDLTYEYHIKYPLEKDEGAEKRLKPDLRADEIEAFQKRAKEMLMESYQLTLDDPDYYIEQELEPDAQKFALFRHLTNVSAFEKFVSELRD